MFILILNSSNLKPFKNFENKKLDKVCVDNPLWFNLVDLHAQKHRLSAG